MDYDSDFEPRHYQQAAFDAFDSGYRRLFLGWHRRAGKDRFAMELCYREMCETPGTYWHLFPKQSHARKAIWLGMNNDGERFIDITFPKYQRRKTNDFSTIIEMDNGSMWHMMGSDKYDESLVGSNVRGVVFSEFALCDPQALDYVLPIVIENGGWLAFITTYRGRNHAYRMAKANAKLSDWYVDELDITQTFRNDGNPVVSLADVEKARRGGWSENKIRQEFYMDPSAGDDMAFYGDSLEAVA